MHWSDDDSVLEVRFIIYNYDTHDVCVFHVVIVVLRMKYILVTGGVISGVGKGIIASSIGTILHAGGLRVTSIKIDPYINIDAGTFSPYEHGWYALCTLKL